MLRCKQWFTRTSALSAKWPEQGVTYSSGWYLWPFRSRLHIVSVCACLLVWVCVHRCKHTYKVWFCFFVFFMEVHFSASLWVCDIWFSNQSHVHVLVRAASIKRVCIPVYMCKRKRGVTELLRSPDGEERSWNMKTLAFLVLCSLAAICLTSGRSDTTVYVREALYQNYCI